MLEYTPEGNDVEGALLPKARYQITGAHIEAQLSAKAIRERVAVFNRPHLPTRKVHCVQKITCAASHFQQLTSRAITLQATQAALMW